MTFKNHFWIACVIALKVRGEKVEFVVSANYASQRGTMDFK
jgi:hypothetical protein